jgi:hypothetical protein
MTRPDPGGLDADPLLLPDLRLAAGSPALSAGTLIADNGGRDWFGNAVSATAAPTIGAYEGEGEGVNQGYCGPYLRPALEETPPSRPRGASFTTPMRAL